MPVRAIVGAQWGDEGKGKITDLLAQDADCIIRFGGGSNAGHTVVNEHGTFKLHVVPSGIFNPAATCLIGTGTVVDFDALAKEVSDLEGRGVSTDGLLVSSRAHVVMPYHLVLDRLGDQAREDMAIGTTHRGVGPTYVDKADRVGIQAEDLLYPDVLRQKLELLLMHKNFVLQNVYAQPPFRVDDLLKKAEAWRSQFGHRIVDQVTLIDDANTSDKTVLLEGQLGALRDLDWGTYPYVTSSTTIAGGGAVGGGVPPMRIREVMGVVKAYITAVGAGPVPTLLEGDEADQLRQKGGEFGATTGRPRDVGWFDAVATRFARMLNGFTGLAVTKLDVLDGMPLLKLCTAYEIDGKHFSTVPTTALLERARPIYEEMPGWTETTGDARIWEDLPANARAYVERIETLVGAPAHIISVGQSRAQTILRSSSA